MDINTAFEFLAVCTSLVVVVTALMVVTTMQMERKAEPEENTRYFRACARQGGFIALLLALFTIVAAFMTI